MLRSLAKLASELLVLSDEDDDGGGGGGGLELLVRLARSCAMLDAADCAVAVLPDWTALKSVLRSVRNWLPDDAVLLAKDEELEDAADVELVPLLEAGPNRACKSLVTELAAVRASVVSPDWTDCRRPERSVAN